MSVTSVPSAHPPSNRRSDVRSRRALAHAVVLALRGLDQVHRDDGRGRWSRCRDLEGALRAALEKQPTTDCDAVPAVRIACAYLASADAEEAAAALLTAYDKLR